MRLLGSRLPLRRKWAAARGRVCPFVRFRQKDTCILSWPYPHFGRPLGRGSTMKGSDPRQGRAVPFRVTAHADVKPKFRHHTETDRHGDDHLLMDWTEDAAIVADDSAQHDFATPAGPESSQTISKTPTTKPSIWEDKTQVIALPIQEKKERWDLSWVSSAATRVMSLLTKKRSEQRGWAWFLGAATIVAVLAWSAIWEYERASERTPTEPIAQSSLQGDTRTAASALPASIEPGAPDPSAQPGTTPGLKTTTNRPRIEAGPDFTDVMIPIQGKLQHIKSFLWSNPVAIAIDLPMATTPLHVGKHTLRGGSAKTLVVAKTKKWLRLRVLLRETPKDYEVVCVPEGIIVRFST